MSNQEQESEEPYVMRIVYEMFHQDCWSSFHNHFKNVASTMSRKHGLPISVIPILDKSKIQVYLGLCKEVISVDNLGQNILTQAVESLLSSTTARHGSGCFKKYTIEILPSGKKLVSRREFNNLQRDLEGKLTNVERGLENTKVQLGTTNRALVAKIKEYETLQGANQALEEQNGKLNHQLQTLTSSSNTLLEEANARANKAEETASKLSQSYSTLESEYQNLSGQAEQSEVALLEANEALDRLREENVGLHSRLAAAPKTDEFSLEELGVMTARRIAGASYDQCLKAYEVAFPQNIEDLVRNALETDERSFVLTPELVALASSIGLPLDSSWDDLKSAALLRTREFKDSNEYGKLRLPYLGALSLHNAISMGASLSLKEKEYIEKAIQDFLTQSNGWEQGIPIAHQFLRVLDSNRENYNLAHATYNSSTLPYTLPIVTLASSTGNTVSLSYIVPCTQETAETNFTRAVNHDLSTSIKESLQGEKISGSRTTSCLGSPIFTLEFEMPSNPTGLISGFTQRVKEARSRKVLSKLGVNWRNYSLGDIYE
ncbi:hypothetical protein FJZ18_00440 [Candidatus Pacearchaeota archaeon]|nr:hypothetical protein [Candidatus Pacearchaeota archaeon]